MALITGPRKFILIVGIKRKLVLAGVLRAPCRVGRENKLCLPRQVSRVSFSCTDTRPLYAITALIGLNLFSIPIEVRQNGYRYAYARDECHQAEVGILRFFPHE